MTDLFLLSEAQMRRIEPFFPLSHGVPRVDDRRVISGIVFVIRNGLRWRDAPREYGPHDPDIRAPTPQGGSMPVIPPPGSPGGDPNIRPK